MRRPSLLSLFAILIALLIAAPVLSVYSNVLSGGTLATWQHLARTVLGDFAWTTLWLCLGVGLGAGSIGVACAWATTMLDFPGRRWFEWALILPLAMPSYVMAYVYTDFLQVSGPLQSALREATGWTVRDFRLPEIRSLGGAILIFSFILFPYVYLIVRTTFLERAAGMNEAARALGLGPWRAFFRVSLPLARPAIVAGVSLALMETLADFGAVAYFGLNTFTTGIYRAWFSLGDRTAAAQLSALLLTFIIVTLLIEQASRGHARFHHVARQAVAPARLRVHGTRAALATLACTLPLLLGFLLPAALLLHMTVREGDAQFGTRFLRLAQNSLTLAALAALLAVALALLLAYSARLSRNALPRLGNRVVALGYAVPGSVIAVGVMIPLTRMDIALSNFIERLTGHDPGLLLTGGLAALLYAYLTRFLAVALQATETGLARITTHMDEAAASLGHGRTVRLARIHLPLLRGSLLTAGLLVFVDVMKELPATLLIRPFNFDTLATQAYTLASDERLAEASTASLAIVAAGLLPVMLLSRQIVRTRRRRESADAAH